MIPSRARASEILHKLDGWNADWATQTRGELAMGMVWDLHISNEGKVKKREVHGTCRIDIHRLVPSILGICIYV